MKFLIIFAAVLVGSKAAKIPEDGSPTTVIHQVTVPVPENVLAPSAEGVNVIPGVVIEVSKDHVHHPDMMVLQPVNQEEVVTVQPDSDETTLVPEVETTSNPEDITTLIAEVEVDTTSTPLDTTLVPEVETTSAPVVSTPVPIDPSLEVPTKEEGVIVAVPLETDKIIRVARAVPVVDDIQMIGKVTPKLTTDMKVIKSILEKKKQNAINKPQRSKRSVMEDIIPGQQQVMPQEMMPQEIMPQEIMPQEMTRESFKPSTDAPVSQVREMSTINPCDLLCTKFEFDPICATNGLCLHEFPNACILDTYNCKNPSMKFSATKDDRCKMHWLTKCEESDMI